MSTASPVRRQILFRTAQRVCRGKRASLKNENPVALGTSSPFPFAFGWHRGEEVLSSFLLCLPAWLAGWLARLGSKTNTAKYNMPKKDHFTNAHKMRPVFLALIAFAFLYVFVFVIVIVIGNVVCVIVGELLLLLAVAGGNATE